MRRIVLKTVSRNLIVILALMVTLSKLAIAQSWSVDGDRLLYQGMPTFLTGVNYLPSKHWLTILRNWDGDVVERDMQAMQSIGVRCIRFFPIWSLVQPQADKVDPVILANLDKLIEIARHHGIQLQIAPLTGFISGGMYFPKWATGNLFTDNRMIHSEEYYMEEMARRFGRNSGVQAFDLGNESNVMIDGNKFEVTPEQVAQWMGQISSAFRKGAPGSLFTVSQGTGMDRYYTNETLAKNSDFMVVHSYIYWHGTLRLDPWIGQRTLYDSNFMIEWARMTGKPVVVQELGASEEWLPVQDIPGFLRVNFLSNWAEGAAGFLWWSSHDIDQTFRTPNDIVKLDRSNPTYRDGRFPDLEYALGLLDVENRPKPAAVEFKRSAELVEQLGQGWTEKLPTCYILVPEAHEDFAETMLRLITPFTLAKQVHFNVKLLYENVPIPKEAAAVVVAGFKLSAAGKESVGQYLNSGGKVYQSQEQDFAQDQIREASLAKEVANPTFLVQRRAGGMSLEEPLSIGAKLTIREITAAPKEEILLSEPSVFARASVGKGTYYFFSGNLETGLRESYNPWQTDDSNLIYSALRPTDAIDISSKLVELFHKQRGASELLMLVNRTNTKQETEIFSPQAISLYDRVSGRLMGEGFRISISMSPMEVLTFDLKRKLSEDIQSK